MNIPLFKPSEHLFLITRSHQNYFLKGFLWTTLNLNGSVLLFQKIASISSIKNLQKIEKCYFQTLRKFVFQLNVATKSFSMKLLMTIFWFKQFMKFCLTFLENGFNFVTQKFKKTENFPFQILRTLVFDLKVAWKPFSKTFPMTNLVGLEGSV